MHYLVRRTRHSLAAAALLTAAATLAPPAAHALQPVIGQRTDHIERARLGATLLGPLDKTKTLTVEMALALPDQNSFDAFVKSVYDPHSPQFHKYLKPGEFADRFGPTPAQYQAAIAYCRSHGLKIDTQIADRTLLMVTGPAPAVNAALHVVETQYRGSDGKPFYAPDHVPALDDNAGFKLLAVGGLDDIEPPHGHLIYNSKPMPLYGATGPNHTFSPVDFKKAYDVPGNLDGTGITLGVLQSRGYLQSDIRTFEDKFSLPHVPLKNVYVGSRNVGNQGDTGESTIDVEMQVAMAPGAVKEIVYIGNKGLATMSKMASDDEANTMSSSLSWNGGTQAAENLQFEIMAAQGQSFFVASGDKGGWTGATAKSDNPEDQPYITSVGGTCLSTDSQGNWSNETAWNNKGHGSGGGYSLYWPLPAYQQGIDMTSIGGSATYRDGPDVAFDANFGISFYFKGAWGKGVGGTSFAAPLWAGITALVDQQRAANNLPPIGFLNPALYSIAQGGRYSSDFHDITQNEAGIVGLYSAGPGYDLKTGWGTPIVDSLIGDLSNTTTPGTVTLVNIKTGQALAESGIAPGSPVVLQSPDGSQSQKWVVTANGSDYVITNLESGLALEGIGKILKPLGNTHPLLPGQQSPPPTISWQPYVNTLDNTSDQSWTLTPSGKGDRLENVYSNRDLSLDASAPQTPWLNSGNLSGSQWKLAP